MKTSYVDFWCSQSTHMHGPIEMCASTPTPTPTAKVEVN